MYPSSSLMSPGGDILGTLLAGSLAYVLIAGAISILITYLVIKTAVRNGVIEAIRKTGLDSGPSVSYVSGYPPAQAYGAPPAPVVEDRQQPPYGGTYGR